jgi:hypothetical protein
MRKPWILAAACSTLALAGCASQRAEAVARAQTPPAGVEVTSTRLVAEGSSARLATPAVAAKAPAGKPINATCPVMLGNPVDPKVTAEWKGATSPSATQTRARRGPRTRRVTPATCRVSPVSPVRVG